MSVNPLEAQFDRLKGMLKSMTIGSKDEPKERIEVQYNPSDVEITRTSNWGKHANAGAGKEQQLEFTGQEGRSVKFELFLDGTEAVNQVQAHIDFLTKLTTIRNPASDNPAFRRPHHVVITWGGFSMSGVIDSLTIKQTMFGIDGSPLRATANVTFKEAKSVGTSTAGNTDAPPSQGGPSSPPGSRA